MDNNMAKEMALRYNLSTGYRYKAGASIIINGHHEVVGFDENGYR